MKLPNAFNHRYWYWRFKLRGSPKLTVDLGNAARIDTVANRNQKRLLAEFLAKNREAKTDG